MADNNEKIELSLVDSGEGFVTRPVLGQRSSSWFGRPREVKIEVEDIDPSHRQSTRTSWFVNKVQTTLTTVKKVVATVPVKAKVAARRGWQRNERRGRKGEESTKQDDDLESLSSDSDDDDEENDMMQQVPKRLETLVTMATMAHEQRPAYMGRSTSSRDRCTRVVRGDTGDAARAAVVALAFERCGEVPHHNGAAGETWRRYLSKRLGAEGARDVLRAVLSHEAFDKEAVHPKLRKKELTGGISSRDEAMGRFAAEARLDFGETLIWLQGRHGQQPQVSTVFSPTSAQQKKEFQALFRPAAVKRDAELNDVSIDLGHSYQDTVDFVSCRVSLGKKTFEDGVVIYHVSVRIQEDETRDYQLRRFDSTFDFRRKALILCQQGLGEVVPGQAPGTILRRTDLAPIELHGPDPGARLVFNSQTDLAEFWYRLDRASQKKSLTNDSAADRAWRLWKQHQDDDSSCDSTDIPPIIRSELPSIDHQGGLSSDSDSTISRLSSHSDDTQCGPPEPPLMVTPLDGVVATDSEAAPLMERFGIVDALAAAVVRPPRWRAPNKALGPRVFETTVDPWCRVDFGAATRRGEREIALECALWAPVHDVATAQVHGPVIIYVHGNSSCRAEALGILRPCCELGFRVCACDLGGSGASGGEHVSLGLREARDVKVVADALRRRFSAKRLIVWGRSMGAVAALLCAGERDLGVDAVIADSPFESLDALCTDLVSRSARAAFGLTAIELADSEAGHQNSGDENDDDDDDDLAAEEEDIDDDEDDLPYDDGGDSYDDDTYIDVERKPLKHGATPPPANLTSTLASFFVGPTTTPPKRSSTIRSVKTAKQIRARLDKSDARRLFRLLESGESPQKRQKNEPSFSPSAWLAAQAAAAVETPLANAVRAKVAEIAKFDVRSLRAGRAAANLGARRVPLCLIASKDDVVTPLNHADELALAYSRGFRERIPFATQYSKSNCVDFDEHGDEYEDKDETAMPLDFVVCSGDHNAPRTQRVLLRVLSFLTKYAQHSQCTKKQLRTLENRFSGPVLRTPPWDDSHLRRLSQKNSADAKLLALSSAVGLEYDDGVEEPDQVHQGSKQLGNSPSLAVDYVVDDADYCGLGPSEDTLNGPATPPARKVSYSTGKMMIAPSSIAPADTTIDGETTALTARAM